MGRDHPAHIAGAMRADDGCRARRCGGSRKQRLGFGQRRDESGASRLVERAQPIGGLRLRGLVEQAEGHLELIGEPEVLDYSMRLDRDSIAAQVGMSPSARHIEPATLAERLRTLPHHLNVTARGIIVRMRKA